MNNLDRLAAWLSTNTGLWEFLSALELWAVFCGLILPDIWKLLRRDAELHRLRSTNGDLNAKWRTAIRDYKRKAERYDAASARERERRLNTAYREAIIEQLTRDVQDWRQAAGSLREDNHDLLVKIKKTGDELDRERMRLAACGTAALCNSKKAPVDRLTKEHYYYSASYSDVCAAVDREIAHREKLEEISKLVSPSYFYGADPVWLVKNYINNISVQMDMMRAKIDKEKVHG